MPKIYRVYFDNNQPLFAEFYSDNILEVYPIGIFGRKLIYESIYEFLLVEANGADDAIIKAKEQAEKNLNIQAPVLDEVARIRL